MYAIYAIYGNMDPINIRPLCYIPAPWIRHGSWNIMKPPGCQLRRRRRGSESTSGHEDFWGVTLGNYPKMSLVQMSSELYLSIIYPDSCAFSSFHVFLNILSLDGLWIFMARPQVAQIYRMYKDLCQHLESGSSGKALSRARQRVARCWTWCGGVTTAHKEKESSAPAEYACRVSDRFENVWNVWWSKCCFSFLEHHLLAIIYPLSQFHDVSCYDAN